MKKRAFIEYHSYLLSDTWKQKKKHWIKLFGNKCVCGDITTNLHHRHYKNFGTEPTHQLILLCNSSQEIVHGLPHLFTKDEKKMKLNLRSLIRLYRKLEQPPTKATAIHGNGNEPFKKSYGEVGTHNSWDEMRNVNAV